MSVAWFAGFSREAALSDADRAWLDPVLVATPAVSRPLVHAPASTHDPNLDDGRAPALVLQRYFDDEAGMNGAQRHLQILATPEELPSLRGAVATHQVMRMRAFRVPEPRQSSAMCVYHVAYEGEADDMDAWVSHDITQHTAIMTRFRQIRESEIGTRLDWRGALSWPHVNRMLRNKVVVNKPPGLRAAPNSPVRRDMRASHATTRKFAGPATHIPIDPAVVDLSRFAGAVAACQRCG